MGRESESRVGKMGIKRESSGSEKGDNRECVGCV